jgi:hypothetical protein
MSAGIVASSTEAIGSVWLIRGRNIGQTIGMTATTYTSTTPVTVITYMTADIRVIALPSAST